MRRELGEAPAPMWTKAPQPASAMSLFRYSICGPESCTAHCGAARDQ